MQYAKFEVGRQPGSIWDESRRIRSISYADAMAVDSSVGDAGRRQRDNGGDSRDWVVGEAVYGSVE